jgi:Arc/MetJ-type ribon-helix-helix transcriptional regulator
MSKWQNVRLPKNIYIEVGKHVKNLGMWVNEQEFIREAVREKISKINTCNQED